ncbi:MAG: HAD family hydrolase [Spirochaetia bacterium]
MKIKAILFDIDGTLYDNASLFWVGIPLILKHWQVLLSFRRVRKHLHAYSEAALDAGVPFVDFQSDYHAQLRGKGETLEMMRDWRARFVADFDLLFEHVSPVKHVVELLKFCTERQIPMGLLSDFPLCKKIERLGLSGYWKVAASTEDAGALKPHSAGFLKAAKDMGFAPQEILFVGNSYKYDVMGARATGMKTAHYTKNKNAHSEADFQFSDYRSLKNQLEQWV